MRTCRRGSRGRHGADTTLRESLPLPGKIEALLALHHRQQPQGGGHIGLGLTERLKGKHPGELARGGLESPPGQRGQRLGTLNERLPFLRHTLPTPVAGDSILAHVEAKLGAHPRSNGDIAQVFLAEPDTQLLALSGIKPLEFCVGSHFAQDIHRLTGLSFGLKFIRFAA